MHPDLLPCWQRRSERLGKQLLTFGQVHLPVFPRYNQAACIVHSLHVLKNVYSKAPLISVTIYLS